MGQEFTSGNERKQGASRLPAQRSVVAPLPSASARNRIDEIVRDDREIIVIAAPAGFGKTRLATAIARRRGCSARCDAGTDDLAELCRRVLQALAQESPERATRIAELRASVDAADAAAWTDHALLLWSREPDASSAFVFDNLEEALTSSECTAILSQLLSCRPSSRQIVMCSRRALPRKLARHLVPHRTERITADDLRLTHDESCALLEGGGAHPALAERAAAIGAGWPIAILLLCRLASDGRLEEAITDLQGTAYDELFVYLSSEYLAGLSGTERDIVTFAAAVPDATLEELCELDDGGGDRCAAFVAQSPFLWRREDDRVEAHPLVAAMVRRNVTGQRDRVLRRAALKAAARGDSLRAAEISLVCGDRAAAVEHMSGLAANLAADALSRVVTILHRFDPETLLEEPRLWAATLEVRRFTVPLERLVSEARHVYARVPTIADPQTRFEVGRHFVSILMHAGDVTDALRVIDQMETETADEALVRRLRLMRAAHLSVLGKYHAASRTFRQPPIIDHPQLVAKYLDLIDATTALRSGQYEQGVAVLEESVRIARLNGWISPLLVSLSNLAFEAWLVRDDARFAYTIAEFKTVLLPAFAPAWQFWLAAAAGNPSARPTGFEPLTIRAIGHLFLASAERGEERVTHVRCAAREAEASADVGLQLLLQIASAEYDRASRPASLARIRRLADELDLPPFRDAVLAYAGGAEDLGALDPFVCLRLRDETPRSEALAFMLMSGAVIRGESSVTLSKTESALFTYLALHARPVSRARICDALWPDSDFEPAANSLKVTVYRLRKKLGDAAIASSPVGYCLGAAVYVDLEDAERDVRSAASAAALSEAQRARLREVAASLRARSGDHLTRFEWYVGTEHRLHELAREVCLILSRDAIRRDDYDAALELVRPLFADDPCDESACELALEAYVALGDGAAARAELRRFEGAAEQLGDAAIARRMRASYERMVEPTASSPLAASRGRR